MRKVILIICCFPFFINGQNVGPRNSIGIVGNYGNLLNIDIPTNAPLGIDFLFFFNETLGVFSEFKYGFGDLPRGEKKPFSHLLKNYDYLEYDRIRSSGYTIINLGGALSLIDVSQHQLISYFGLGVSNIKYYDQYYSNSDFYYYDYSNVSNFNICIGLQYQTLFHSSIKIGYDTNPGGFVFGLGHTLSL